MALHTLGTNTTTSLTCTPAFSQAVAQSDGAAIDQSIIDDRLIASILGGYSAGATAVLATGSTHSNTTLDTLVSISGAPISQIAVGDIVLGIGITSTTAVAALISGTSVQLSQAATTSSAGVRLIFVRPQATYSGNLGGFSVTEGMLIVPNRGALKLLPGDFVAIDNTGWPILLSGNSQGYAGSQWTFT